MDSAPLTEEAKRREARRRRILENSHSRLAKLGVSTPTEDITNHSSGTSKKINTPASIPVIHPDPEFERDVYERPQPSFDSLFGAQMGLGAYGSPNGGAVFGAFGGANDVPFGGTGNPEDIFNLFQGLGATPGNNGDNPLFSMMAGMQGFGGNPGQREPANKAIPLTMLTKILRSKLQISIIAIVTYLLAASDLMFRSHVFTLFLLWEAFELFVLKPYEKSQSSYLGIVFLFTGIPTEHSMVFMKWLSTIRKVFNDVAIFVFFFVVSHLLWQNLVVGQTFSDILDVEMTEEYDRLREQVKYEL